MNFLGCDPGRLGAIAIIDDETNSLSFITIKEDDEQCTKICDILETIAHVSLIAIEDVHAFQKGGTTSAFSFGWSVGHIHGICDCLKIPVHLVQPKEWQATISKPWASFTAPFGLDRKQQAKLRKEHLKKSSLETANRLFPGITIKHDGISDAICIAEYMRRHYKKGKNHEESTEKNGKESSQEKSEKEDV